MPSSERQRRIRKRASSGQSAIVSRRPGCGADESAAQSSLSFSLGHQELAAAGEEATSVCERYPKRVRTHEAGAGNMGKPVCAKRSRVVRIHVWQTDFSLVS
jgi:hypothetical protein